MADQTWKEKYKNAKQAFLIKDFVTVQKLAKEAKEDLIKSGFVHAEPLFRWIEQEWLEKGIVEGVIKCKDGKYYPVVKEIEAEISSGFRGRTPITEKRKSVDASGIFNFLYRYEEFRKKKISNQILYEIE